MKRILLITTSVTLFLFSFSCDQNAGVDPGEGIRELSQLEKTLVESDNVFGFKLFREIVEAEPDSNVFISPLSVAMALGMTLNGAAGDTYEAMKTTLELHDLTEEEINDSFRSLIDLLINLDSEVIFEIANSIWTRLGYPVLEDFYDVNRTTFDAEVRELDFSLPEAVDIINGWVSDKTHGKIEEVLDFIDPLVVMYLINAIYFKGTWTYAFDESQTTDGTFYRQDGTGIPCKMMHMKCALDHAEFRDFQIVDLPYGNGQFSMTILLPHPGRNLDTLIEGINSENWQSWLDHLETVEIDIALPRFTLEYELLMNDVLVALGMGVAFSGSADFSRINPYGGLYISRVIHKTFVDVNEEGTEAAAVTVVELREFAAPGMTMNRPFLFVIRENHSGTILFIGKCVEPAS